MDQPLSLSDLKTGDTFRVKETDGKLKYIEKIDHTTLRIGPVQMQCKNCGAKDTFTFDVRKDF
jgi:hypothetical protein